VSKRANRYDEDRNQQHVENNLSAKLTRMWPQAMRVASSRGLERAFENELTTIFLGGSNDHNVSE
jgi:hypothetical protein